MFEVCDSVCNTQCVSRTVTVCVLGSAIFALLHDGPNIYLAAPYLTSPHNDQCQYNCKTEKTWNIFHRTNNWKRAGSCLILKKMVHEVTVNCDISHWKLSNMTICDINQINKEIEHLKLTLHICIHLNPSKPEEGKHGIGK